MVYHPWSIRELKYGVMLMLTHCEEEDDDEDEDEEQFFQESETLIPSTSSTANEEEEPICLIIEEETEAVTSNDADAMHTVMAQRAARGASQSGGLGGRNESGNTSQSHNDATQNCSVRGSNVLGQVPSNPLKRKFIQVETNHEFSDQNSVIRDITYILKTMYGGPWSTWKKVGKDDRDAMWQHFKIKMEAILKRLPTGVEVYEKLHTKKSTQEFITPKAAKVKEAYESAMVAKFGDDTTSHPLLDNETCTIRAPEDVYERVREQMSEEINMKADELEAKHQQMRVELDAKTAHWMQNLLNWRPNKNR
ncbi:hypothetical protein L2E82_50390 [Cichorium intybus]|nr:hypothetical protein L2E82_50390 [Cichorium intybus]